ncbi:MAG: DUF6353 family protein, partial [Deinococcota bacterium]|nr:DUF6353 family protein [Deinococcota bacterium]
MFYKNVHNVATRYMKQNSSAILTAGGVIGTVATAVLSGRAAVKAHDILAFERTLEECTSTPDTEPKELSKSQKALLVWPAFIPPVLVGTATIGSIVAANYMSARRAAALAAAYGMSQKQLEEYKAKVTEKLTGPKRQAIDDEIAQDRVTNNPPKDKEVIILAGGDVLCYDMLTGRYFRSTVEQVRKAESKINADLVNHQYASLSSFYDEIGLPATNFTDTVGWGIH